MPSESSPRLPETQRSDGLTDPALPVASETAAPSSPKRRSRRRQALLLVACLILGYLVLAYVILPFAWIRYAHRHPEWEDAPRITHTIADILGDPLNVGLVGTEAKVIGRHPWKGHGPGCPPPGRGMGFTPYVTAAALS